MEIISSNKFYELCDRAVTIFETKNGKPKVFETDNGDIVKMFYPKRKRFSSDMLRPYALRFCLNAKRLIALGFAAPKIKFFQYCPELETHIVCYEKLQGESCYNLLQSPNPSLVADAIAFVGALHKKGVFFKSIHLRNMIYQKDGNIALLDVTDVKFKRRSLSLSVRYRNFVHLLHRANERKIWMTLSFEKFFQAYFKCKGSPLIKFFLPKLIAKNMWRV